MRRKSEEGYTEEKWMRECVFMEKVMEVVAVEQILNLLPAEMRVLGV